MLQAWYNPNVSKEGDSFLKNRGLRVEDGVEGNKREPRSGKDREGSARNKADEEWNKMFGGRK